ncbi:MAG: hypothetical protein LRY71_05350 [Bacillaceae bacterium]|nr:hypothetical protein [Bacillaceae bacterium]
MKRLYEKERASEIKKYANLLSYEVFTEDDLTYLPEPVQNYFRICGYIGKPKIFNADVIWKESFIKLSPEKDWTPLETRQFNSIIDPFRIAYMKALTMPLQVRDLYRDGQGHMYGKLFNLIPVVNVKGKETSQSALITLFTEILFIPSYSLQDYIKWEPIDSRSAKAKLTHKDLDVTGVFYFDEAGRFIRFETNDRYYTEKDGTIVKKRFSAIADSYKEKDGLQIPNKVRIIWHLESGNYEYFKGVIEDIIYNVKK